MQASNLASQHSMGKVIIMKTKDRFIGLDEVKNRVNRGRAWIYAKMKANEFPKKHKLGWLESDIDHYIKASAANDELQDAA